MIEMLRRDRTRTEVVRLGYFHIALELLEQILFLPPGVKVVGVKEDLVKRTVQILVEGGDIPLVLPGERATELRPQYRVIDDKTEFVSWGI